MEFKLKEYEFIHHDWYSKKSRLECAPEVILQPDIDKGASYELRIGDQVVRIFIDPDYMDRPAVHLIY
jgi:hypothetical protein